MSGTTATKMVRMLFKCIFWVNVYRKLCGSKECQIATAGRVVVKGVELKN